MTVLIGVLFGFVYMAVDYGIFHLLTHSRTISEGYSLFWVLLWMSMSYGFTNFAWIWLWLNKDRRLFEWSLLILSWWFCCPLLAGTFAPSENPIVIQRTTGAYHGWMALILFIGYLALIIYNLWQKRAQKAGKYPMAAGHRHFGSIRLGVWASDRRHSQRGLCHCGREAAPAGCKLPAGNQSGDAVHFAIFIAYSRRFTEQLSRREATACFHRAHQRVERAARPRCGFLLTSK